jgi:hypothetical protein
MHGATERFLGGVGIHQLLLLFLPVLYVCFLSTELSYCTAIICFLGTLINAVLNLVTYGMQNCSSSLLLYMAQDFNGIKNVQNAHEAEYCYSMLCSRFHPHMTIWQCRSWFGLAQSNAGLHIQS